eukprot:210956-Ditylum_brightwellii.AAC.1
MHKAVEGEISKLKGKENQLRYMLLCLTLNGRALQEDDNESDDGGTVDMNDTTGDMDDVSDNLL